MVVVTWIFAGALPGGAASALDGSAGRAAFARNVAVGIAGVMLGGWLLGVLIGAAAFDPGVFGLGSLLVSLMAASVLLTLPHVFRTAGDAGRLHAPHGASTGHQARGSEIVTTLREPK
jgi:uncharacterized membrane protein YeaQ/YmgE (transglycosylase-associated protein family)